MGHSQEKKGDTTSWSRRDILGVVAFFAALLVVPSVLITSVRWFVNQFEWFEVWVFFSQNPAARLVVIVVLVVLGRGLLWVREHLPRTYGLLEIYIGAATISSALLASTGATTFDRALRLATGVYLIVRGHDNRIAGYARLLATRKQDGAQGA